MIYCAIIAFFLCFVFIFYISTHSWEASANNSQLNVYSDILAGITNCNQLLRDLGETNPETSNPVRAARAFYTFLLMDNF